MAFQQPQQRPAPQRQVSFTAPARPEIAAATQKQWHIQDSQEWILFSPQEGTITRTQTNSTEQTARTAGLSRLSDFGSLGTAVRSEDVEGDNGTEYDDGEELDSLDDGLRAFHEPSIRNPVQRLDESGGSVLPAHDGLGTFQASSSPVQEHLWQFERYNPRRRHRRRSSLQRRLNATEDAIEENEVDERRQRIEKWRVEQSRALLDEIERETRRRRRMSRLSDRRQSVNAREEDAASFGRTDTQTSSHATEATVEEAPQEKETFWQRFTRRVMHDLIGLDDDLLSVIFGEALPADVASPDSHPSPTAKEEDAQLILSTSVPTYPEIAWERRLIQRLSKELGMLVHQLTDDPGAFSTYLRERDQSPYATHAQNHATFSAEPLERSTSAQRHDSVLFPRGTTFLPTLRQNHHLRRSSADSGSWNRPRQTRALTEERLRLRHESEYWERDLDVNTVFGYFRNRFASRSPTPVRPDPASQPASLFPLPPSASADPPAPTTAASELDASARRAAIIQHHHPLIPQARTAQQQRGGSGLSALSRMRLKRTGSGSGSCRTQSTKKSRSESSRNFWDIGGSVGGAGGGGWGKV